MIQQKSLTVSYDASMILTQTAQALFCFTFCSAVKTGVAVMLLYTFLFSLCLAFVFKLFPVIFSFFFAFQTVNRNYAVGHMSAWVFMFHHRFCACAFFRNTVCTEKVIILDKHASLFWIGSASLQHLGNTTGLLRWSKRSQKSSTDILNKLIERTK